MWSKGICWKRAKVAEETVSGIIENVKDTIVNDIILGDSRSRGEVFGRGALAVGEIVFGSKGITQGIKGTGAAKNAVSAVDMMGDAADAVGDTAKGVKILGKIEDAEDIADTAGDVAESARKAEKVIDGVESGLNSNLLDELNFSNMASQHMGESGRQVPVQTLQDAIRYGEAMPDPRGSNATMYYTTMYKNGKMYNLEVLYDATTNTVYHFEYARKAMGNLPAIK